MPLSHDIRVLSYWEMGTSYDMVTRTAHKTLSQMFFDISPSLSPSHLQLVNRWAPLRSYQDTALDTSRQLMLFVLP